MVVAAVDASYLAEQASRTAWLLLGISYALLVLVGWSSWQQVRRSLAARIHAINTQLLSGRADESHESFDVDGHELRELADSVSAYIKRTLEEKSSSDERYRRLVELAPDAVLMCADTRIRSANPAAIAGTTVAARISMRRLKRAAAMAVPQTEALLLVPSSVAGAVPGSTAKRAGTRISPPPPTIASTNPASTEASDTRINSIGPIVAASLLSIW